MKALYNVPAPAKLNLFLHINGRRDDGYHLLQSVFMLIDWCDTLHFDLRQDGQLRRKDLTVPLPANDLILRAAQALQAHTGCKWGADIAIEKHIPAQAGMGGGSSDAATCLLALNRLWRLDLPLGTLETLGLRLGADVPFFLRGHNAWVEGIGEHITPLAGEAQLPHAEFLVIKPEAGLETSKIFSAEDLYRATDRATIIGFAAASKFDFGRNDLQAVAERLCPQVSDALGWFKKHGLSGRMTGSGSAVFAQLGHNSGNSLKSEDFDGLPENWQTRICSNLDVHPLAGWVSCDD